MSAKRIGDVLVYVGPDETVTLPLMQNQGGKSFIVGADDFELETPYVECGPGVDRLLGWAVDNHAGKKTTRPDAPLGAAG